MEEDIGSSPIICTKIKIMDDRHFKKVLMVYNGIDELVIILNSPIVDIIISDTIDEFWVYLN